MRQVRGGLRRLVWMLRTNRWVCQYGGSRTRDSVGNCGEEWIYERGEGR